MQILIIFLRDSAVVVRLPKIIYRRKVAAIIAVTQSVKINGTSLSFISYSKIKNVTVHIACITMTCGIMFTRLDCIESGLR